MTGTYLNSSDKIVCPYCNVEMEDAYDQMNEYMEYDADCSGNGRMEYECGHCGKMVDVRVFLVTELRFRTHTIPESRQLEFDGWDTIGEGEKF